MKIFESYPTLNEGVTISLGFSALYYGLTWFIDAIKALHAANKLEGSDEYQVIQGLKKAGAQFSDPSLGWATNYFSHMANATTSAVVFSRVGALVNTAGVGFMFFGAYKAANSFSTGEDMGTLATATCVGAAIGVANNILHKI